MNALEVGRGRLRQGVSDKAPMTRTCPARMAWQAGDAHLLPPSLSLPTPICSFAPPLHSKNLREYGGIYRSQEEAAGVDLNISCLEQVYVCIYTLVYVLNRLN